MIAALAVALSLFGGTPCTGAAARDTEQRCVNASKSVEPTPDEAALTPNVACVRGAVAGLADACAYGAQNPVATVALLGDSHAAHWRAGLEVVAKAKRWRVLEFARPHCPFSYAVPAPSQAGADECVAYNQHVLTWLAENPQVATVFVSNNARLEMAERGKLYRVQGDMAAFAWLPPSVKRIFVLRDTPTNLLATPDCIRGAIRRKLEAGARCAVPRKRALVSDPTVTAAARSPRARVIDLTPFFCSSKECFPVVGGVLVHKDQDHLTQDFSASLGPYITRAIDRSADAAILAPSAAG
ncbi:SGNH hydrolase domain-containing protein [Solirubrobacter phytolaccae]|uniref:SGNH hydrolase domain-containing protein n=1 Tax=Solirubrobacter phytolaccae TaxID=1404360 RepID=A0A9X3NB65_9ACTN|nr:SGNH hydrolase domain-containing protein [Solirubrobacter phytolaccae]MDA0183385.1 SGNH hydrolase domain-containing protein [Solirubrobacter phytolaccae]